MGQFDLYNIQDTSLPDTITINHIKIWAFVGASKIGGKYGIVIRTGGTNYFTTQITASDIEWKLISNTWTLNPKTGVAWTKADLNALQIGPHLTSVTVGRNNWGTACTQIYAEVDYDLAPEVEGPPISGKMAEVTPVKGSLVATLPVVGAAFEVSPVGGSLLESLPVIGSVAADNPVMGSLVEDFTSTTIEPVIGSIVEIQPVIGSAFEVAPVVGSMAAVLPVVGAISELSPLTGSIAEDTPIVGNMREFDVE